MLARNIAIVALSGILFAALAACTQANDDARGSSSALEEDGGAGGGDASDGSAVDIDAAVDAVFVPSYTEVDANSAHLRWAMGTSGVIESAQTQLEIYREDDRRFRFTAATATPSPTSGKVVVVEFGKGAAFVGPGSYSCSALEAAVVVVRPDGSRLTTARSGAPQRSCLVEVDQAPEDVGTPAWVQLGGGAKEDVASHRRVLGRVQADLGPKQEEAPVATTPFRAAFSAIFQEKK